MVNPVTNAVVTLGNVIDKELPYQVYPAQLDGDLDKCYWLPMYFAAWAGKSMVLPDEDASAIYQHGDAKARPEINVSGPPAEQAQQGLRAVGHHHVASLRQVLPVPDPPGRHERRRTRTRPHAAG